MSRRSRPMASGIGGSWWAFALRGLIAVLFGLLVIIWPSLALFTLPLLITLFSLYILVDGVVTLVGAMRSSERRRWLLLIEGLLGVLAGLVTFFGPDSPGLRCSTLLRHGPS